jgi:hypothetical protein
MHHEEPIGMDVLGVRELQEIHGRLLPISQACCVRPLADPSSVLPFPLERSPLPYIFPSHGHSHTLLQTISLSPLGTV